MIKEFIDWLKNDPGLYWNLEGVDLAVRNQGFIIIILLAILVIVTLNYVGVPNK